MCRRERARFRRWWPCTAAAGCRACAAHSSIGGRISRRAAMRCLPSAIGWRRQGRRRFRTRCRTCSPPCSSCGGSAKRIQARPGSDRPHGGLRRRASRVLAALGGRRRRFRNGYPQDAHAKVRQQVKVLVGVYGVYDCRHVADLRSSSPHENNIDNFLGCRPDRGPPALFRRLADQLRHRMPTTRSRVFLACRDRGRPGRSAAPTPTHSCWRLKQAGFFVRTCIVQGAGHYWMNDPIDEPTSYSGFLAPRLLRFLAEKL